MEDRSVRGEEQTLCVPLEEWGSFLGLKSERNNLRCLLRSMVTWITKFPELSSHIMRITGWSLEKGHEEYLHSLKGAYTQGQTCASRGQTQECRVEFPKMPNTEKVQTISALEQRNELHYEV